MKRMRTIPLTFASLILLFNATTRHALAQNFIRSAALSAGGNLYAVTAADVNGDGWVALTSASGTYPIGSLRVLTNNRNGTFTLSSSLVTGGNPSAIAAVDVNGDGKVDLISVNFAYPGTLSVLTNDGSGGFVLSSSPTVGTFPQCGTAADVNGDGKVDLITGSFDYWLTVLTNNGSGGFVLSSSPRAGNTPQTVIAADVNNDGKVDLTTANYGAFTVGVLTNNGSSGFGLIASPHVGSYPWSVAAADVNNDGKADLISADNLDGTLTVLLNSPAPPALNIQRTTTNTTVLSWCVVWPGFGPQQKLNLGATNWVDVPYATNIVNGVDHAILPPPVNNAFYRLKHP